MRELTDLFRYDVKKDKWVEKRDYELVQSFKFSGSEFYLLYKCGYYFIGYESSKGNLYSLIYINEDENELKLTPGEVVSYFRKQYLKNGINRDKIERFLSDPIKFGNKRQ